MMNNNRKGFIESDKWLHVSVGLIIGIFLVLVAKNWLGQLGVTLVGGVATIMLIILIFRIWRK